MREVVITGIGVVLPNCDKRELFWKHLRDGESQLEFEADPSDPTNKCAIGRIRDFDPERYLGEFPERFYGIYHRELQIYLSSLLLARDDARLELPMSGSTKMGLFDGSARMNFGFWYERIRRELNEDPKDLYTRRELMTGLYGQSVGIAASLLHVRGPTYAFAGTCSSGAIAVGHAYREIALGEIDFALATGHDSCLAPPLFRMYHDANLISREREDPKRAIKPYVGYSANAFGEGAVTLVLEERERAERRNATILCRVAGYKHGNNGYHPTTVDVAGVRPAEIIKDLLRNGERTSDDVDFVVGHGNAVQLSDVSEENYMRLAFGPRAREVPLISTKPIYGHTLGASSSVNIAAAALMLHHGYVIPTINIDEKRQKRAMNHQPNRGQEKKCDVGISLSYGMGGHNAALLLRAYRSG